MKELETAKECNILYYILLCNCLPGMVHHCLFCVLVPGGIPVTERDWTAVGLGQLPVIDNGFPLKLGVLF